ncbi:A/G-specific adenine glycosylase [Geomobilimonas luticola]|uniref:Adenine DNA glycosylase n=1 Tax=Geomobilimonas luticola TaxID=1114878 RepID=A0ABS5SG40_9BACT|nr:A/G-specific adenine glycosylase [Geomobilimonas luticola]MBT0654333.1 A/G-specific adenine glycosylase [Geomobilimonas luticola]
MASESKRHHPAIPLTTSRVAAFRTLVYGHYHANPRPLPWRDTVDPYAILVSEIMLQQTQVDRVRGKYADFLDRFPDIATLAAAPLPAVLTAWQGLGYNRRAIALHRCAQTVVAEHGGRLPADVADLETLPGIGPYTARAIAAFAFHQPTVFIETNIRTVFIHQFCQDRQGVHDRELLPLVEQTLDRDNPRDWYYALMDYGVMLKKAHPNPGRRSAHHVRQSPFKGSNRELRSRILKHILAHPACTAAELAAALAAEPAAVERNLVKLAGEGFIIQRDGCHFIG